MATKNINAEKIRKGNLDVNAISATTFNINNQYDLPNSIGTNGDFLMYSGGSASWEFIEPIIITGTTGGTIPFVNSFGTGFEYKSGFNFDGDKLNITKTPNVGVSLHKEGGISISGDTGGVITLSGYNDTLSAATINSDNDLLINATGATPSVFGQDKQLFLSSSNPYVGINTTTPQAILHVKGDSNTTGEAFKANGGQYINGNYVRVFNNHSTINSGTTNFDGGVSFSVGNQDFQRYTLPTLSGKTDHVLTRTDSLSDRDGDTTFNVFWIDHRDLGNSLWLTGNTNGVDYMRPSLPDVEVFNKNTPFNEFWYESSQGDNFITYDNWFQTRGALYGKQRTAAYKSFIKRTMVLGTTTEINRGAISDDFTSSLSNALIVGTTDLVNGDSTSTYFNYNDFSANTNTNNVVLVGGKAKVNASRNAFIGACYTTAEIKGGTNVAVIGIGIVKRPLTYDKDYPGNSTTQFSLDTKNIIQFGSGNVTAASDLYYDNTINFGRVDHEWINKRSYYRDSTSNYYGRKWPLQTEGIWFGSIDTASNQYINLGMFKDPLLSGSTDAPLNMGHGTQNVFFCTESLGVPTVGINRPGSGAGIFYLHGEYANKSGGRNGDVPTSGITNAVGLVVNERYIFDSSSVLPPGKISGLYIHTDANRGHWIGDALFVNPKREIATGFASTDYKVFNLSGSTGALDVIGSGTTSGTTSVRIKNSGDTVGLEVLDDGQVYFNNIPTSSGSLSEGAVWSDSGTLSIVPGVNVCGHYDIAEDTDGLIHHYQLQTQTYDSGNNCISNGTLIQTINDVVGSNTLTQTTSSNQFTWNDQGGSNDYCYLSTTGLNDFMNFNSSITLNNGYTALIVLKINSTDSFRLMESSTTGDYFGEFTWSGTDWNIDFSGETTTWGFITIDAFTNGDWIVMTLQGNTSNLRYVNINGPQDGTPSGTISQMRNLDRFLVGGNVEVSEFMLFNTYKGYSTSNAVFEESRLMNKYNIT